MTVTVPKSNDLSVYGDLCAACYIRGRYRSIGGKYLAWRCEARHDQAHGLYAVVVQAVEHETGLNLHSLLYQDPVVKAIRNEIEEGHNIGHRIDHLIHLAYWD